MLSNMEPDSCPEGALTGPLYRKIRDHPDLALDIRDYDRMPENDARRSYTWLMAQVEAVVHHKRTSQNFEERDLQLRELINRGGKGRLQANVAAGKETPKNTPGPSKSPGSQGKGEAKNRPTIPRSGSPGGKGPRAGTPPPHRKGGRERLHP